MDAFFEDLGIYESGCGKRVASLLRKNHLKFHVIENDGLL